MHNPGTQTAILMPQQSQMQQSSGPPSTGHKKQIIKKATVKSSSQTARHTLNQTVVDSHARASSYNAGADRASFSST